MDLEEIGINEGNWVDSAQDRNYWRALVNAALNLWVPYAMELVNMNIEEQGVANFNGVPERAVDYFNMAPW